VLLDNRSRDGYANYPDEPIATLNDYHPSPTCNLGHIINIFSEDERLDASITTSLRSRIC